MNLKSLMSINKVSYNDDEQNYNSSIKFNGDISDATIDDPSLKFNRPRYIKQANYRAVNNIQFVDSEYDLSTIATATNLDGILNRSVNVFTEQITKNGYEITIPDDRVYNHVFNRLKEIQLFTNISMTELVTTLARQLVTYGNAYLVKNRKGGISKISKSYELYGSMKKPIVGLFLMDAATIKIGLDIDNQIKWYKQVINGQEKLFDVDEVIHFYYNRGPGLLTGRSSIIPVLDDVRALRKLEEEAEILGFQYAVPLYLYKVGTDNHPAAPGEIDSVAMEINHMNTYGIMCVPHTHSVETVTSNNDPIDIMKYIDHFKKRIYTGLGVSPTAMGESDSSNRSTAEAAYLSMQAITKSYQQIIKEKLELELLKEIILDGGFDPLKFEYEMRFNEIDLEATIKKETHVIQKYQSNLITLEEARIEMQMEAKFIKSGLYMNQIQIPLIKAEAAAKIKVEEAVSELNPAPAPSKENTTTVTTKKGASGTSKTISKTVKEPVKHPESGSKNKLSKTSEKRVTGKSQPQNQHGKQLSRPVFKKDSFDELIGYVEDLKTKLLDDSNYQYELNRSTFINKSLTKVKNTILNIVTDSTEDTDNIYNILSIRLTDRVNRLNSVNSIDKYNYITDSILNEFKSLENYLEINDEEENQ